MLPVHALGLTREVEILLYYNPIFLEHDTGHHPENAARLLPTVRYLDAPEMEGKFLRPDWQPASRERIQRVHSAGYVDEIKAFAGAGGGHIEPDTVISPPSPDVALMAAGSVCDAVERLARQEDKRAFCLVRPPGHHAMPDHAMGFCLFNNVAVGARVAIQELGYQRVLIIDWDVHHGNGTQESFWEDPQVAYFSMHREPFYPFTGSARETGSGAGLGTTRNLPIAFGTSREEQLRLFEQSFTEFADGFKPQLIIISAGFDAHKRDPIGSLGLESEDFATMTRIVVQSAETHANGQVISVLEGGYDPAALADCIQQHLGELTNTG